MTGYTPMWAHQQKAFDDAKDASAWYLALGMGTGKSRVVIELAKWWALDSKAPQNILIVCPKSVIPAWQKQFALYDGDYRVHLCLDGSVKDKAEAAGKKMKLAQALGKPFVCVINYDSAWRPAFKNWSKEFQWDLIVADEIHRIKAPGGRASLYMNEMRGKATRRLGLSGTPMPHSPMDLYAQYRFLDPSIFGTSFVRFRAQYAVMGGYLGHQIVQFQNTDRLHDKMYQIMTRVSEDVLELPEALHVDKVCRLGPKAQRIYDSLKDTFVAEVRASDAYLAASVADGRGGERPQPPATGIITASNAMVKLLRLSQVANGCARTEGSEEPTIIDTAKQDVLVDILEDLAPDEPVVVFARFRADLDAIAAAAKSTGRGCAELSGRRNQLGVWQAGGADSPSVLAVQIEAGGVGIDLTRARYCVYYSVGFSLGSYRQSLARVHRPGQERSVIYLHIKAEKTVDGYIYKALSDKEEIVESVLRTIREEICSDEKGEVA